jgi:CHAT domain-containing protein
VADIYTNKGVAWGVMNRPDSAIAYYDKALGIYRSLGLKLEMIKVLYDMSLAHLARGDNKGLFASAGEAVSLFEKYQSELYQASGEETALAMTGDWYDVFALAAIGAFRLGKPDSAFHYLGMGQGRLFEARKALLSSARGSGDKALEDWGSACNLLSQLQRKYEANPDDKTIAEELEAQRKRVKECETRLLSDPKYKEILSPKVPSLRDIKGKLGPRELLISYYYVGDSLWGFVVSKDTAMLFNLGPDTSSDIAVHLSVLMDNKNSIMDSLIPGATALYDMVLRPILAQFPGTSVIHVIPHKGLSYYPLEALMPSRDSFLIERGIDVIYYTSAKEFAEYEPPKALKTLFAYAPLEYNIMPKKAEAIAQASGSGFLNLRPGFQAFVDYYLSGKELSFGSLRSVKSHVEEVAKTWKERTKTDPLVRFGEDASEGTFKKDVGGKSRPNIILLATHGCYGWGDDPYTTSFVVFYGAEALARAKKDGGEDGFLTGLEVMTSNMKGVDMVFLAACETGVGRTKGGEGIFGLRRAFHSAGVKEVVSTLWEVPTSETMDIMKDFFADLLSGEAGYVALRDAKLNRIREGRQSGKLSPLWWAGPVLSR